MPAESAAELINASAVGEYVYCARAHGLRRATADATNPAAAARAAQGRPATWRPGAHLALAGRRQASAAARRRGALAHHQHHRAAWASQALARVGLLILAAGLLLGLLALAGP